LPLDDTDVFRGSTTDVECGTAVDGARPRASYEEGGCPAVLGRCPGCDEARLRMYVDGGEVVEVTLGTFGFKARGGTTSGSWDEPTAGLAAGANALDRLREIVPIVVESLIKGGGAIISERVE
jgi:hypothetical protein